MPHDLFAAAAERVALHTGQPLSQALAEIKHGRPDPDGPLFAPPGYSCLCGTPLPTKNLRARCTGCGK